MMATSFETFIPSINAFGSLVYPSDPLVATTFPGVTDLAAGDCARTTIDERTDPFGAEVIRFYNLPNDFQDYVYGATPEQGIDFFTELDLQAQALGFATFALLYASDTSETGPAFLLLQGIIGFTVTPIGNVGGPAGLFFLYSKAWTMCTYVYWMNFAEHRVRNGLQGVCVGQPIYSDPANEVANPNVRAIGQGGSAVTMQAWGYRGYPYPARQTLNDAQETALLEWQSAVASEAAYSDLVTAYEASTAIAI